MHLVGLGTALWAVGMEDLWSHPPTDDMRPAHTDTMERRCRAHTDEVQGQEKPITCEDGGWPFQGCGGFLVRGHLLLHNIRVSYMGRFDLQQFIQLYSF